MVEPKVTVNIEAEDQLGLLVRQLVMESGKKGDLRKQAHAVVERITYLGELKVIEIDGPANAVQIRSRKPNEGYIEIILRNGSFLSLERRPAPLHLSRADYDRLLRDLKEVLAI